MDTRPIGVFDSGLGGLTAVRQLRRLLPGEDIVYFGCLLYTSTAIREALGDKAGIVRYGSCMLPMDETLALCAVDLGGRPYFVYDASFAGQSCGGMDVQMAREFFYAVSYSAMMNLHLKVLYGENDHHKLEAMYKACLLYTSRCV